MVPFLYGPHRHAFHGRLGWGQTGGRLLEGRLDAGTVDGSASGQESIDAGFGLDLAIVASLDASGLVPGPVAGAFRARIQ